MEIYQLKTFVTVAKLAHLTRAAERLHLTQPAVSKQIKALEEELGVTLFERTPTGVVLTKSGRSLLQLAEQTMESAFDLMREAKRLRTDLVGTIRANFWAWSCAITPK
jgi:DNA-binding transcriptional LysR family regulator